MAALICFLLAGMILCFPGTTISASQSALSIWARDIVPSLFPYMVLCKMTRRTAGRAAGLHGRLPFRRGDAVRFIRRHGAESALRALRADRNHQPHVFRRHPACVGRCAKDMPLPAGRAWSWGAFSLCLCSAAVPRQGKGRRAGNAGKGKWKSNYGQRFFRAGRGRMHRLFQRGGCLHPYSFPVFAGNRVRLSAICAGNRGRHAPADPNVKRILCARCEHGGADRLWRLVDFNAKPPLFAGVRRDAGAFALPRAAPGAHVRRGYGASPLAYMSHFRSASNACRSILLIWLWLTPMIFAVSFCVCSRT